MLPLPSKYMHQEVEHHQISEMMISEELELVALAHSRDAIKWVNLLGPGR